MPANIPLLTLPPDGPEPNRGENIWQYLRQNRVFDGHDAIVDVCCDAGNALVAIPERIASLTSRDRAQVSG